MRTPSWLAQTALLSFSPTKNASARRPAQRYNKAASRRRDDGLLVTHAHNSPFCERGDAPFAIARVRRFGIDKHDAYPPSRTRGQARAASALLVRSCSFLPLSVSCSYARLLRPSVGNGGVGSDPLPTRLRARATGGMAREFWSRSGSSDPIQPVPRQQPRASKPKTAQTQITKKRQLRPFDWPFGGGKGTIGDGKCDSVFCKIFNPFDLGSGGGRQGSPSGGSGSGSGSGNGGGKSNSNNGGGGGNGGGVGGGGGVGNGGGKSNPSNGGGKGGGSNGNGNGNGAGNGGGSGSGGGSSGGAGGGSDIPKADQQRPPTNGNGNNGKPQSSGSPSQGSGGGGGGSGNGSGNGSGSGSGGGSGGGTGGGTGGGSRPPQTTPNQGQAPTGGPGTPQQTSSRPSSSPQDDRPPVVSTRPGGSDPEPSTPSSPVTNTEDRPEETPPPEAGSGGSAETDPPNPPPVSTRTSTSDITSGTATTPEYISNSPSPITIFPGDGNNDSPPGGPLGPHGPRPSDGPSGPHGGQPQGKKSPLVAAAAAVTVVAFLLVCGVLAFFWWRARKRRLRRSSNSALLPFAGISADAGASTTSRGEDSSSMSDSMRQVVSWGSADTAKTGMPFSPLTLPSIFARRTIHTEGSASTGSNESASIITGRTNSFPAALEARISRRSIVSSLFESASRRNSVTPDLSTRPPAQILDLNIGTQNDVEDRSRVAIRLQPATPITPPQAAQALASSSATFLAVPASRPSSTASSSSSLAATTSSAVLQSPFVSQIDPPERSPFTAPETPAATASSAPSRRASWAYSFSIGGGASEVGSPAPMPPPPAALPSSSRLPPRVPVGGKRSRRLVPNSKRRRPLSDTDESVFAAPAVTTDTESPGPRPLPSSSANSSGPLRPPRMSTESFPPQHRASIASSAGSASFTGSSTRTGNGTESSTSQRPGSTSGGYSFSISGGVSRRPSDEELESTSLDELFAMTPPAPVFARSFKSARASGSSWAFSV